MLDDVSPLCVNQIITVKFPESFLSIFFLSEIWKYSRLFKCCKTLLTQFHTWSFIRRFFCSREWRRKVSSLDSPEWKQNMLSFSPTLPSEKVSLIFSKMSLIKKMPKIVLPNCVELFWTGKTCFYFFSSLKRFSRGGKKIPGETFFFKWNRLKMFFLFPCIKTLLHHKIKNWPSCQMFIRENRIKNIKSMKTWGGRNIQDCFFTLQEKKRKKYNQISVSVLFDVRNIL